MSQKTPCICRSLFHCLLLWVCTLGVFFNIMTQCSEWETESASDKTTICLGQLKKMAQVDLYLEIDEWRLSEPFPLWYALVLSKAEIRPLCFNQNMFKANFNMIFFLYLLQNASHYTKLMPNMIYTRDLGNYLGIGMEFAEYCFNKPAPRYILFVAKINWIVAIS